MCCFLAHRAIIHQKHPRQVAILVAAVLNEATNMFRDGQGCKRKNSRQSLLEPLRQFQKVQLAKNINQSYLVILGLG